MLKAILFDLDETIILDAAISMEAFRTAAQLGADRHGADADRLAADAGAASKELWAAGPYVEYCTRIGHSAWEGLWARYDRGEVPSLKGLRAWAPGYQVQTWVQALARQGIADESLAAEQAEVFKAARRRFPRYADVDPVLEALRSQGLLLGIVTNGVPDLQREKIAGCGVAGMFNASVVSGELDCGKPDPGIFRHICQELGVAMAECVMVGDNQSRDVAGAIAAGMKSVWIHRNGQVRDERYPADLDCTDLSVMIPWLKQGQ